MPSLSHLKNKLFSRLYPAHFAARLSYSQSGEDMIAAELFRALDITNPTYLDIGASHPSRLSNTYHFYLSGASGVAVEPNPDLAAAFRVTRPRDTVIEAAITPDGAPLDFHLLDPHTLSTTDTAEKDRLLAAGQATLISTTSVSAVRLIDLITTHSLDPDRLILSLDIEGGEPAVLSSHDFTSAAPRLIILETIEYAPDLSGKKRTDLIDLLSSKGYRPTADTRINTIFLREDAFP
jgi:FkbM family methyltransferase